MTSVAHLSYRCVNRSTPTVSINNFWELGVYILYISREFIQLNVKVLEEGTLKSCTK